MPHFHSGNFDLPFSGVTPISSHRSFQGAVSASERVGRQSLQLLALYAKEGSLSDWQAKNLLGWERSTVNARRATLIQLGLVVQYGSVLNPDSGLMNVAWGLTGKGLNHSQLHPDK
jgi:hypothetical protein